MNVAVGQILDQEGFALNSWDEVVDHPRGFDLRRHANAWATPIDSVRTVQPAVIPLLARHDRSRVIGEVVHLEHRGRQLWAVCELPGPELDPDKTPTLFFSAGTLERPGVTRDVLVDHLGLVERTASLGLDPIRILPGPLYLAARCVAYPDPVAPLVKNAAEAVRTRKRGDAIVVRTESFAAPQDVRSIPPLPPAPRPGRNPVAPQHRPGWQPGMIEWSQPFAGVLSVR